MKPACNIIVYIHVHVLDKEMNPLLPSHVQYVTMMYVRVGSSTMLWTTIIRTIVATSTHGTQTNCREKGLMTQIATADL